MCPGVATLAQTSPGIEATVADPEAPPISLQAVTKHYRGGGGVDEVTFQVDRGQVFGFLGPNGAGKTTTIRLLLDLIRPDAGRIELFGLEARRHSVAIRGRIGYLPGDLALYDRLTARELLTHFAHLRGGVSWEDTERLAARFELELDRPIRALSKGNRQKVGLVQALMGDPRLLILDEPTSGLDPLVQHQVHALMREVAAEGRTVFLSSHVLSEVGDVADRVGLIREGRIVAVQRVEDLRRRSVHLVDVVARSPWPAEAFARVPGVRHPEVRGTTAHLEVSGPIDPVVKALAGYELEDLSIREPNLEELFLAFYKGQGVP